LNRKLNHHKVIKHKKVFWLNSYLLIFCFLFSFNSDLFATHNRSGEITYEQIGPLSIRATITTYTKASSTAADRDSLELFWGDGASEFVLRFNGDGEIIPGTDIKKNLYIAEHTYPGRATYTLAFTDPNRVSGILNVNFPNSVDVEFYLETTFTLLNPQFEGENNSAVLLQAPIDFACVNKRFIHNPNAFDPDGDSLSYELIVPLEAANSPVPQYIFPDQVAPGPNNTISLDPITGDFIWESPQSPGEYNIAIRINEYRNGALINSLVRDMQIFVDLCDFSPPEIFVKDEICVIAGERIDLDILVTDPDVSDLVFLSATGGPFNVNNSPAQLIAPEDFSYVPFNAKFVWQTTCEHISPQTYQIVLRAQDNAAGNNLGLADLKTVLIRVLGPAPYDLEIAKPDNEITLTWEQPYLCEDAANDYFLGFSVWRKQNSNPFLQDSCEYGLNGKAYSIIEFITNESSNGRYTHTDLTAQEGIIYCYRVLAEFALKTNTGNPYNRVASIPSIEVCEIKNQDFPLLLNTSVESTDSMNGDVFIRWTKPNAFDLDTLVNTGPYFYNLLYKEAEAVSYEQVLGASFQSQTFDEKLDSSFTQQNLNTRDKQYEYKVEFSAEGSGFMSESTSGQTIFLSITPGDESSNLTWDVISPWQNFDYKIYRFNDNTQEFDSIGITTTTSFKDQNLSNGQEYCYRVLGEGSYGLSRIESPLLNYSQQACNVPVDNEPPCQINLTLSNPCEENANVEEVINELLWNNANIFCPGTTDAASYNLYYAPSDIEELQFLASINDANTITFEHEPLFGSSSCYAVTALDSLGNESELSEKVCIDNCPSFELPNTFTPNNDGANDLFVPIRNRFINNIRFKVYNRWGNLMFETSDPQINWDGNNSSGKPVDEGVYYYTCDIFESELDGLEALTGTLEGFIHLIRSN